MISKNINKIQNTNQTLFHDFFSEPNNPEELFSPLFTIYKSEKTEIFKAIYNETREIFCIKKINSQNFLTNKKTSKNFYNQIKEETSLMKCLKNNENILQYHGSFFSFENKDIYLVYEYLEGSVLDLGKILDRNFTDEEIAVIINDILHGLIYMHQLNIVNRNIQINNILLTSDGKTKIGNFEKAKQKLNINNNNDYKMSDFFVKDKSIKENIDPKYDIFLIAIACIEMFINIKNIFQRDDFIQRIKNNRLSSFNINILLEIELKKNPSQKITDDFRDFIIKCLDPYPNKRPTAFELLNHPFIKKNVNEINKNNFSNLVKNNLEKIENYKENFYKNNNNILLNDNKKSINLNINNNISNNNNTFDNKSNYDELAEFRIEQMKNNENIEDDDNDKNISKDLYSNLDNNSFISNNEKKEKNFDNIDNNNIIIKEPDDLDIGIDFKSKWEHLKNFQDKIINSQISDNNLNYNYDTHILKFNTQDEDQPKLNLSLNKSISNVTFSIKKGIAFTDSKCDIIKLSPNISQKSTKKSNDIENKGSTRYESLTSKNNNNIIGIILDKRNSCIPFKIKKNKFEDINEINIDKLNEEYYYKYLDDLFENNNINKEIQRTKTTIIKVKKLCKSQKDIKKVKLT